MATQTVKKAHGSKRFQAAAGNVDMSKVYEVEEAMTLAKANATAKFDETIGVSYNLNLLPKHTIRDTISLPNSFGKAKVVLVFAEGERADQAKAAGADYVGSGDLVEKIQGGWVDFDVAIATPDMMKNVGKLGKVLGRRGLMPNPKTGTVTNDLEPAITSFKKGRMEFRADKNGIVHLPVGKASMDVSQLVENFTAFHHEMMRKKPSDLKGDYIKSIAVSSTMGPGIALDQKKIRG